MFCCVVVLHSICIACAFPCLEEYSLTFKHWGSQAALECFITLTTLCNLHSSKYRPQMIPSAPSSNIPQKHGLLSKSSGCGTSSRQNKQASFWGWEDKGALFSEEWLKEFEIGEVSAFLVLEFHDLSCSRQIGNKGKWFTMMNYTRPQARRLLVWKKQQQHNKKRSPAEEQYHHRAGESPVLYNCSCPRLVPIACNNGGPDCWPKCLQRLWCAQVSPNSLEVSTDSICSRLWEVAGTRNQGLGMDNMDTWMHFGWGSTRIEKNREAAVLLVMFQQVRFSVSPPLGGSKSSKKLWKLQLVQPRNIICVANCVLA